MDHLRSYKLGIYQLSTINFCIVIKFILSFSYCYLPTILPLMFVTQKSTSKCLELIVSCLMSHRIKVFEMQPLTLPSHFYGTFWEHCYIEDNVIEDCISFRKVVCNLKLFATFNFILQHFKDIPLCRKVFECFQAQKK